jgi:hypothetical protein
MSIVHLVLHYYVSEAVSACIFHRKHQIALRSLDGIEDTLDNKHERQHS